VLALGALAVWCLPPGWHAGAPKAPRTFATELSAAPKAAYLMRAVRLVSLEGKNGGNMPHLLPVQVQSVSIAIDARQVHEIVGPQPAVLLPGARAEIPGVMSYRGKAVGLFDFAAVAEGLIPLSDADRRPRVLVVQLRGSTLAAPVDLVREVRELPADALLPPRLTAQKFSVAEVEIDGVVMPVFDFAAFLESVAAATQPADLSAESAHLPLVMGPS
jgi:chemotaxis signal transduction protein